MEAVMGMETVEIETNFRGRPELYHPTLIWDKDEAILVDAGIPGQASVLKEAMTRLGIPFEKLRRIIITHHDLDHIGGLPEILNAFTHKIEVLATAVEKPFIEGRQKQLKITPEFINEISSSIPPQLPEERRKAILDFFENPPKANVDQIIADEERLPVFGGITVIHTPGHTPGHISLYHNESKTLIAGDAFMMENGSLVESYNCTDDALARESLKRFLAYNIDNLICYHGGILKDNVNQRILDLINS